MIRNDMREQLSELTMAKDPKGRLGILQQRTLTWWSAQVRRNSIYTSGEQDTPWRFLRYESYPSYLYDYYAQPDVLHISVEIRSHKNETNFNLEVMKWCVCVSLSDVESFTAPCSTHRPSPLDSRSSSGVSESSLRSGPAKIRPCTVKMVENRSAKGKK